MKFLNYRNKHTNTDRIYTKNEIRNMLVKQMLSKKDELVSQYETIGLPTEKELGASSSVVWVNDYYREDGTHVSGYWRSKGAGSGVGEREADSEKEVVQEDDDAGTLTGAAVLDRKENEDINYIYNNFLDRYFDLPLGTFNTYQNNAKKQSEYNNLSDWEREQMIAYQYLVSSAYPIASKFLYNAMHDMQEAKNDKNAEVLRGVDKLRPEIRRVLISCGVPKNSFGIIYNENSDVSKLFSNALEFKKALKKKNILTKINENNLKKEDQLFQFGTKNIFNFRSFDRRSSMQHAILLNPRIENGYLYGTIVDYYDFVKRPNTLGNIPNNWGKKQQDKCNLTNYYICVKIKTKL